MGDRLLIKNLGNRQNLLISSDPTQTLSFVVRLGLVKRNGFDSVVPVEMRLSRNFVNVHAKPTNVY